jgi:hypothetical protein
MKTKAISIAATALLLALSVKANTVSYSQSYNNTLELNSSLALQQFDTSLGTLTSITLGLYASTVTSGTVENTSSEIAFGSGSFVESQTSFQLGNSTIDNAIAANLTISSGYFLTIGGIDYDIVGLASGESMQVNGLTANGDTTGSYNSSDAFYTMVEGNGTFAIDFSTYSATLTSISPAGDTVSATLTGSGALVGVVTYNYTAAPVPEPTTMALFGIGSLGLFLIRRRK